jgi:lipopolysaccharide/colanic/teichoic acid biosynthesis glycosyltransferase
VFKGDMSFVGPRPELQQYVDLYTEEQRGILRLRPGVTDWASIVHFDQYVDFTRGDDPDRTYLDEIRPLKVRLQMFYLQNHSLWIDFKILAYTLVKLAVRNDWLPREIRPLVSESRRPARTALQ